MKKLFIITIKEHNGYQMPMGTTYQFRKNSWFEFFKNKLSEVTKVFVFKEPDLQFQEVSFCFLSNKKTLEITKILPLALKWIV